MILAALSQEEAYCQKHICGKPRQLKIDGEKVTYHCVSTWASIYKYKGLLKLFKDIRVESTGRKPEEFFLLDKFLIFEVHNPCAETELPKKMKLLCTYYYKMWLQLVSHYLQDVGP